VLNFAVFHWVWWPVKVSGDSMVPNYYDGQPTYIDRLAYLGDGPHRGDVVGLHMGKDLCIKRVIGLPGEKIEFHRDAILINGHVLFEPYAVKPLLWWVRPVQLGANEYFVMGDNRTTSKLDAVPREQIIGKAVF
jgi:signal peptidase I